MKKNYLLFALICLTFKALSQSTTFNYTGNVQTYVVPAGVTLVGVDAVGGCGGGAYVSSGVSGPVTLGGRVQCNLAVTPGQTLYIYVGGGTTDYNCCANVPGGFNGGGTNGTYASGGGGATDIRLSAGTIVGNQVTPYTATNRIVIAGGGGGGGDFQAPGGAGGGLIGADGGLNIYGFSGIAGSGGTQSGIGPNGLAGALGVGGAGSSYSGGGGGGGLYGGNGANGYNGGGGGSSYTDPGLCTSVVHTQGYSGANGNGAVTLCPYPVGGTVTGTTTVCSGSTTALTDVGGLTGGTWSSSNGSIASVGTSGIVTGIGAGVATISYSVSNGCGSVSATAIVTVNPLPSPITTLSGNTTFSYTGTIDNYTVPLGVTTITVVAKGAQGGGTSGGGLGASIQGDVSVTPGQILKVLVGQQGQTDPSSCGCSENPYGNGGGGGSFVTTMANAPLVIAGGGGGAGIFNSPGQGGLITNDGGAIGTSTGGTAGSGGTAGADFGAGCGGPGHGGGGLLSIGGGPTTSGGRSFISGGAGGSDEDVDNCVVLSYGGFGGGGAAGNGGGGGGGYSGGGGGSNGDSPIEYPGGGGGGSYNAGASQINTAASNTGDGSVVISYDVIPAICVGSTVTLLNATPGGTWVSSNVGQATIGSSSGIVTGVAAGTPVMTYMLPTGCYVTMMVTVNPLPAAITGTPVVCAVSSTTLADASGGGTWTSSSYQATVGGSTGVVTGVAAGTPVITYTLPTGCYVTQPVTVNGLPEAYTVTGGGSYCAGGAGVNISLSGSDNGIRYQLYVGATAVGSPVDGNGSLIDFGNQTASGTYTVAATDTTTGCMTYMMGAPAISINPLPDVFIVTGGGAYCFDGSGVSVGLSGSEEDFHYQVFVDGSPLGSYYSGSGSSMDFGLMTAAGTYKVVATNPSTGCVSDMADSVIVIINPLPPVHTVTGGGSYCADLGGMPIGLDNSNGGIRYQLYYGIDTSGSPVDGIDTTAISFGNRLGGGTYTVWATDTTTGCQSLMDGSATITVLPLVYPGISIYKSPSADTICDGTHVTFTTDYSYGGLTPHFMWQVNGTVVGLDSGAYDYAPANGDKVNVLLVSSETCPRPDTVSSDTLHMGVLPNGAAAVGIVSIPGDTVCLGTTVTLNATPAFGGAAPGYLWIKNTSMVSTNQAYIYTPVDSDNVYCLMFSNYMCLVPDTAVAFSNSLYLRVEDPIVPSVTISGRPGMLIGPGKPDTLTAVAMNAGLNPSYQWYLNAAIVPGATSSVWIRTSFNNKDSVSCMVTRHDACGLSTINSVVIHVGNVGVKSVALNADLALIPNPNKGAFTIKGSLGSTDEEVQLDINNMLGQAVYNSRFTAHNGIVNEVVQLDNSLANGMYMLNVHTAQGTSVFRFVVER